MKNFKVRFLNGDVITIKADEFEYGGISVAFSMQNKRIAIFPFVEIAGFWTADCEVETKNLSEGSKP